MRSKSKKKQIHVSIIGSCVCRDIFSLSKNAEGYGDHENEYIVDRFIQSINPLSAVGEKMPEEVANKLVRESSASSTSNFYKRNFKLDVQKSWDDYLSEVRSEWLVVDFSTMRLPVRCFGSTYVTQSLEEEVQKGQIALPEDAQLRQLAATRTLSLSELTDTELEQIVNTYLDRLLQIYPQQKIIVVDVKHVFTYIDEKGQSIPSPNYLTNANYQEENRLIALAYDIAKKRMPKAFFVDELPVMIGNAKHVWGKCGLHYVDDIYLYFYRCVDGIAGNRLSRKQYKSANAMLMNEFTRRVFGHYSKTANEYAQNSKSCLDPARGLKPGVYRKNGLTLTVDEDRNFHVEGTTTVETIFYLYSGHGNPCGEWLSVKEEIAPGMYIFSTRVRSDMKRCYIQMVLTTSDMKQKWIFGNLSSWVKTDCTYQHCLVRIVVCRGEYVDITGRLTFEKIK
ncbi:MAG: hypothetical protein IJW16_03690 [Clostridia bacterium]|nr:hypothetical protein [Clostridia bacterium]